MRLRKVWLALAIAPLALGVSRCGSASPYVADGGPPLLEAGVAPEAGDATLTCGPLDVTGFQPKAMHPPNPPHAGKCTLGQSADFAACESGDPSKCGQFGPGQPAEACGACIDTHAADATWGVIVFDGSLGTINTEGCVDDALGDVKDELASGGSGSCGDTLHASYECQDAACPSCTGYDLTACVDDALAGGCEAFDAKARASDGPCGVLVGDAKPPDLAACFADLTIADVLARRTDFLTRIANYMCGPKT